VSGAYKLIIAEKPSVGRDIARVVGATSRRDGFLEGRGVRVSWCVGHLAELCEPHEYDAAWKSWAPRLLPIVPDRFRIRPSKHGARQLAVLRTLLRDSALIEVINACDAGREGELIFRYVYELTGARAPVRRLWISSLTEQAIRAGLSGLRPSAALDSLADAARCRSEADWLVGMNGTRALTGLARRAGGDALMSVGRVQTPTLALIVRREEEIERFVSQAFWHVDATFACDLGSYKGRWHRVDEPGAKAPKQGLEADASNKDGRTRIGTKAEAEAIAAAVTRARATVTKATRKKVNERPPLLFDLTSLQKVANLRFKMTAQETLATAQSLYEKHKIITYPRTDSRHLTGDMTAGLASVVDSLAPRYPELAQAARRRLSEPGVPGRRMIDDGEVGDHHAIIPTGKRVDVARLGANEAKIFDAISRRFLAGLLPDAVFAKTRIETMAAQHLFVTEGRVCLDSGWQMAEPRRKRKESEPLLPAVEQGTGVDVAKAALHEGKTEPPKRYVDATLLGAMERADKTVDDAALRRALRDKGMGTPATRAAIIENLIRRRYVDRVSRDLQPTVQGRALIAVMPVDDLLSAELTGAWEAKLAQVARGDLDRASFMADIGQFVRRAVTTIAAADGAALAALPRSGASRQPCKPAAKQRPVRAKPERAQKPVKPPAPPKPKRGPRCPACAQGTIIAGHRAWGCTRWNESCGFVVAFVQHGMRVPPEEAERLFRRGQSRLMDGLSPTGKARLVVDLDCPGNVRIELGKRARKQASARPVGSA